VITTCLKKIVILLVKDRHFPRFVMFLLLSFPLLFIGALMAEEASPVLKNAPKHTRIIEVPLKTTGVLFKPGNRQDPFYNPMLHKKTRSTEDDDEVSRGTPPPGIAGTYIAQAILQGIVVRNDGRVAVVRGADSRAYFLKEGDKLFDGYLKAIDGESVTFVRETKFRSGKNLTNIVVKRLRTP
jgi:hypothetical protein